MKTLFKLPFKILALPFALAFFLVSLAMRFLAWVSGRVLALASLLFAVGGAILLFQGEAYSGVGLLVMGFLVSARSCADNSNRAAVEMTVAFCLEGRFIRWRPFISKPTISARAKP